MQHKLYSYLFCDDNNLPVCEIPMKKKDESLLPMDCSSECARARLSTNMTRTSKTNRSTKELSSLQIENNITELNRPGFRYLK